MFVSQMCFKSKIIWNQTKIDLQNKIFTRKLKREKSMIVTKTFHLLKKYSNLKTIYIYALDLKQIMGRKWLNTSNEH